MNLISHIEEVSVLSPYDFGVTAVAERFVRGVAAPAQGGFAPTVGDLAIGAPDLDLPIQDERAIHRGDYLKLSTIRGGPG